jgi:YVTN family beta-propeller protein
MTTLKAVQHPIETLPIVAKLSIPGSPDWVGIGPDAVWISNKAENSVARIEPSTATLAATVHVSRAPCSGIAVGFGSVWSPSCADQCVDRIDADTNRVVARIRTTIADSEGAIAVSDDAVWLLSDQHGTLLRIDPDQNRVQDRVTTAPGSFVPAYDGDSLWVTSTQTDLVSRVDPKTNSLVGHVKVGPSPRFSACGDGAVWVLNQGDGTVSRIDPATNSVVATIEVGVPGQGGDIAFGEGFVWVTAINVPLSQIDSRTNKVVAQYVGTGGDALRVGHRAVWLCSFFLQEVWKVPLPLR